MATRPNSLSWLTPSRANTIAIAGLGLGWSAPASRTSQAVVAELVRSVLWLLWSQHDVPVSSLRFFNLATTLSQPLILTQGRPMTKHIELQEGTARDFVRTVIDELEMIGDLSRQPKGNWLPSPLRLVELSDLGERLVVGGCPARLLPRPILNGLRLQGLTRVVDLNLDSHLREFPRQHWSGWARVPNQGLREWTEEQVACAAFSGFEGHLEGMVYAPERAGRFANQFDRWLGIDRHAWKGERLVQVRARVGFSHYVWARFESGQVVQTAVLDLEPIDRRRLLYGLDQRANNPTVVECRRIGEYVEFVLRSALPAQESRLLLALGELKVNAGDRFYPRVWKIPARHHSVVREALVSLGIELVLT